MINKQKHPASFKDPAGFIFIENGQYLRQVNAVYRPHYEALVDSGLYKELADAKLLVPHEEIDHAGLDGTAFKVLKPVQLGVMSYPYEWSFHMLKDAALATLQINMRAIEKGMILKDASSFNMQVGSAGPLLLDTLSFEIYNESRPWIAYRQFCQHFLFPLKLMESGVLDAPRYLLLYMDGIPVENVVRILPRKSWFNLGALLHIHLQNRVRNVSGKEKAAQGFSKVKMLNLLNHLHSTIEKLKLPVTKTKWSDYYDEASFDKLYLEEKSSVFNSLLEGLNISSALDLGCNNGHFSLLLANRGVDVISVDADMIAVDKLYQVIRKQQEIHIKPMVVDCSNPGPPIGWMNEERTSFLDRINVDLVIALALVHHLYFTHNTPLDSILRMFATLTRDYCIVEFVDINDPKSKIISKDKQMLVEGYTRESFEKCCERYFTIQRTASLSNGNRTLYLLKK